MTKNTTNWLLIGAAGLAALFVFGNKSTSSGTSTTNNPNIPPNSLLPNSPPVPTVFNQQYYETYEYPAMLAANPNIGNSNYSLTDAEARQYLINNNDIAQWAAIVVPTDFPDNNSAARYHWKTYGVAGKYSFMPFAPTKSTPLSASMVQSNQNQVAQAKSGGSSFWSGLANSVLGIGTQLATTAILAGCDNNTVAGITELNEHEQFVVTNGAAILFNILPYYNSQTNGSKANAIENRFNNVLLQIHG
jgi:hypothetical protein